MTKIEWADETLNPFRAENLSTGGRGHYCIRVSEGCRNCYAERLQPRFKNPVPFKALPPGAPVLRLVLDEEALRRPLTWKKPRRIFLCSMTDPFLGEYPTDYLDALFAMVAVCQRHTFMLLTKRPERMLAYLSDQDVRGRIETRMQALFPHGHERLWLNTWPLPNLWLGVSIEDQQRANERLPMLLATPAAKRFVSAEPLLGELDLIPYLCLFTKEDEELLVQSGKVVPELPWRDPATTPPEDIVTPRLDWVICGGESGPNARPVHPDWVRGLRDQCSETGVPFFFKQWGEWAPGECCEPTQRSENGGWLFAGEWSFRLVNPIEMVEMHRDDEPDVYRVGKKKAGDFLDGKQHHEVPS